MKILLITLLFAFSFMESCIPQTKSTTDEKVSEKTEQMMAESNKMVGMPNINNWQEKKLLRDLYELRDQEKMITYTYIVDMNGRKLFLGKSIGYGLPASVQFSNPEKMVHDRGTGGRSAAFTKQPEPNGLFMPDNLTATWVFLLDGKGDPRPVYIEPLIIVSPFPLH